ncbi:MAG: glycosyltransferase [Candidatus Cryptobacteroides sp.]
MNIAFIHTIFPGGGAERISRDIAESVNTIFSGKYNFFIFAQRIVEEALTEDYKTPFKAIETYPIGHSETKAIEDLVKKHGIDIIVLISRRIYDIKGFRKRCGCKVVFANHGEPFHLRYELALNRRHNRFKDLMWKIYRRRLYEDWGYAFYRARRSCIRDYENCDRYVILCREYKDILCRELSLTPGKDHISVINNPEREVNDVCFDKDDIILFSGRLEQFSKRVDRLLRIWEKVVADLPGWRLLIAGEGADGEMLRGMAREMGLERIEFLGYQSDMTELYRKASILCLTSQSEGWGLCLTEAQANGVIPIAFGCTGGIREILSPDGVNGFIVTPFDEDEYAAVLKRLATMDEKERAVLRHNAVSKAKQFSPGETAKKWAGLFSELI